MMTAHPSFVSRAALYLADLLERRYGEPFTAGYVVPLRSLPDPDGNDPSCRGHSASTTEPSGMAVEPTRSSCNLVGSGRHANDCKLIDVAGHVCLGVDGEASGRVCVATWYLNRLKGER